VIQQHAHWAVNTQGQACPYHLWALTRTLSLALSHRTYCQKPRPCHQSVLVLCRRSGGVACANCHKLLPARQHPPAIPAQLWVHLRSLQSATQTQPRTPQNRHVAHAYTACCREQGSRHEAAATVAEPPPHITTAEQFLRHHLHTVICRQAAAAAGTTSPAAAASMANAGTMIQCVAVA
jgi:hypothetical protein